MVRRGPKSDRPRAEVQSVRKTVELLGNFTRERPEWGVNELARAVGMDPSSVSRTLGTLQAAGFVRTDPQSGRYRLGFALLELASVVVADLDLRGAARPVMRDLALTTQETVNLAVLDGIEGVVVEQAVSGAAFRYVSRVGRRIPLHATSHGKILLAFLPATQRTAVVQTMADSRGRLTQFTGGTISTAAALEAELETVRAQGFASAWAEHHAQLAAIAAPVFSHTGEVVASLAVPGPMDRYGPARADELVRLVRRAAERISSELGWRESETNTLAPKADAETKERAMTDLSDAPMTRRRALATSAGVNAARMVTAGTLVAACAAPAGSALPAAPTVGPISMRFTYWGATPDEVTLQNRVISDFTAKHPQIKVENAGENVGNSAYQEKLVAQAAAGTWADVGRIQSVEMARSARDGLLSPLDELIRRDRYSLDDFWPGVLPMTQYQQKRYTLPVIGSPAAFFWSPKLFRDAGLTPATDQDSRGTWTWETMAEAARRLTKQDEGGAFRVGGYAVGPDLSLGGIAAYLWSAGGDYYNSQLTKSTIAEPAAIEAVQFLVDLIQRQRVWPSPAQATTGLQWFPGATIGMQLSPTTSTPQWRQDASFEFDVVSNPKGKGGQIGRLNANGYGIFAGSKAQEASWLFLQHLASTEQLKQLASTGRSFPWRKSIAQTKEYRDQQPIKSVDVVLKLAEKGKSWPIVASWNDAELFANPIFREMGNGTVSVREGLERIRVESDRLLAR